MKGKMLRIALAVAVLGALAAIPASTQVPQTSSQTLTGRSGGDLPLVLLVNRLELSRGQMETLRTTIRELLAQRDVLDQKRAAFEQEMIAFNGTAEELDARIASFDADMAAVHVALREKTTGAVDTLKETLTMKQGEILMNALPGLMGRVEAASSRAQATMPRAVSSAGMQRGRIAVNGSDAEVSIGAVPGMDIDVAEMTDGAADIVGKIQSFAEQVRDRISARRGGDAAPTTPPDLPMRAVSSWDAGTDSSRGSAAPTRAMSQDDFGTLTISLADELRASPRGANAAAGRGLMSGLERLVDVLERKLAAMS